MTAYANVAGLGQVYNVKQHGAVGDASADDTAVVQAAIDAVEAAGGGVVYFPRGTYRLTAEITTTASSKVSLIGEQRGGHPGGSILWWSTDLGVGKYGLKLSSSTATDSQRVAYLKIQGPGSGWTAGTAPANMNGIRWKGGWTFEHLDIQSWKSGIVQDGGDHQTAYRVYSANNYYGCYWGAAPVSNGDQCFMNCNFDGNTMASIAVADDNMISGALFFATHFGAGPYCFLKEVGAGANTWLSVDMTLSRCAFEGWGNAIAAARGGNASFAANLLGCATSSDFDGTKRYASQVHDYAIDMGGQVVINTPGGSPIKSVGTLGGIRGSLTRSNIEVGDLVDAAVAAGVTPFSGSQDGTNQLFYYNRPCRLSQAQTTVSQYDLLEKGNNDAYVSRFNANSVADPIPAGVALHAGVSTDQIVYGVSGLFTVKDGGAATAGGKVLSGDTGTTGQAKVYVGASDKPYHIFGTSTEASSSNRVKTYLRGLV